VKLPYLNPGLVLKLSLQEVNNFQADVMPMIHKHHICEIQVTMFKVKESSSQSFAPISPENSHA
jgi:hypothetical protein